jgi:ribosome-binding factor A
MRPLGNRTRLVGEQMRKEISVMLQLQTKDPRIGFLTISRVDVSSDMSYATVRYSVLGDEKNARDTEIGLHQAAGWLRRELSGVLRMRHVPELRFELDKNLENSLRIQEILNQLPELKTPPTKAAEED